MNPDVHGAPDAKSRYVRSENVSLDGFRFRDDRVDDEDRHEERYRDSRQDDIDDQVSQVGSVMNLQTNGNHARRSIAGHLRGETIVLYGERLASDDRVVQVDRPVLQQIYRHIIRQIWMQLVQTVDQTVRPTVARNELIRAHGRDRQIRVINIRKIDRLSWDRVGVAVRATKIATRLATQGNTWLIVRCIHCHR